MTSRLLILGGTLFLGRHVVDAALAKGLAVTIFHRGKTGATIYDEERRVEVVHGDRRDAAALGRSCGRFDAVIDTCGYIEQDVLASCAALSDAASYAFVSTISVYPELTGPRTSEDDATAELPDGASDDAVTGGSYGPLKARCERVVRKNFGERALIVRPGLIAGPFDPSDRFTYWSRRAASGGTMVCPGDGERLVQVIDVRDLAEFLVEAAAGRKCGTVNAVGVPTKIKAVIAHCLDAARAANQECAEPHWVPEPFLIERGVQPWTEMPMWIPGADQVVPGARAAALGLKHRPLADLAAATLKWDLGRAGSEMKAGLTRARDAALLKQWRERSSNS